MASNLWSQRDLIANLARREVAARNKGTYLGFLWALLMPLLMLAVYTFVFAIVWQSKWGVDAASHAESRWHFALNMFCGLIVFDVFSQTVSASPAIIVQNPNYVKKVVFPVETLPIATMLSSLVFAAVSVGVLVAWLLVSGQGVSWTLVFLPAVLAPLLALTLGVSWFLASLGVFLRDIKTLVSGVLMQVLFFLSPIFYSIERVPEQFRPYLSVNPLTPIIENTRRVVLAGKPPEWISFSLSLAVALVVLQLGYAWFMKSKRGFADVL